MTHKRISLGDRVVVQLYNTAGERRVKIGNPFESLVGNIEYKPLVKNMWQRNHPDLCRYQVWVIRPGAMTGMWVWQYEIVRRERENG